MREENYTEDFNEEDNYYEDLEYDEEYDYLDDYGEYDDKDSMEYDRNSNDDQYDEYEEKEEKDKKKEKHYYLKDSIKGIIFIILVILLVIILLGFFKANKSKVNKIDKNEVKVIKKIEKVDNDDIFNKMKDSSLKYFTKEKLESENSITLGTMKELNIIDFVDDKYDSNKSIATINENKLVIDVYRDNKKSTKSYIVGNYIYCKDTYYCEKSTELESKSYEYTKEGKKNLSDWSNWSEYEEASCDIENSSCRKDDMDCLTEVRTNTKQVQEEKNMVYQTSRNAFKTLTKEVKPTCSNYDYIKINGVYYRTEKNSNFKMVGAITKDTKSNYYNWVYIGRKKFHNPPSDTINTRYVFVNEDYSNCGNTCSDHPDYYYDVYSFNKQLTQVNDTNECGSLVNRVVPNYSIEQQKITVSRNEKQTTNICYKSERTRELSQEENIIKWSNYNDKKLLKDGYNYTGEYK